MPPTGSLRQFKLQASGVQQDPPMFQALVSLLDEKAEPLRAVAFIALQRRFDRTLPGVPRRVSFLPRVAGKSGWTKSPPNDRRAT